MPKLIKCRFCKEKRATMKAIAAHVRTNHRAEWAKFKKHMEEWGYWNERSMEETCDTCTHKSGLMADEVQK